MAKCKGCNKEIIWGLTAQGTKVPLDPRAPVYAMESGHATKVDRGTFMVTHFSTCPKANDFSSSKKVEE